ncbi:hypothetical protein CC86DRAFT_177603 [Ophiobolus disseminans]|uniref:Uncharacterized protein n=1 Tax=Ophiobolus disseminans TaxID=1469910 RepID=A0A6A7AB24_9PLEO|nr:hypothetical protein CC86DRAFT_177603 [Ophiobolus disseminans]
MACVTLYLRACASLGQLPSLGLTRPSCCKFTLIMGRQFWLLFAQVGWLADNSVKREPQQRTQHTAQRPAASFHDTQQAEPLTSAEDVAFDCLQPPTTSIVYKRESRSYCLRGGRTTAVRCSAACIYKHHEEQGPAVPATPDIILPHSCDKRKTSMS